MLRMTQVNTCTLTRSALNWAVAQAEGLTVMLAGHGDDGLPLCMLDPVEGRIYDPAENWELGGQLCDQHDVDFTTERDGRTGAKIIVASIRLGGGWQAEGADRLTAACRAVVCRRLGYSVQVPAAVLKVNGHDA